MRARIFHIVTNEKAKDGSDILTRQFIEYVVGKYKCIKRYAYILHDKDIYAEDDEKKNGEHKRGNLKEAHWHIVLQLSTAVDVENVAKWFNIPVNFVDIPRGKRGAGIFLDIVEYLMHEKQKEQLKGKHLYSRKEVTANFDFEDELDKRALNKARYGSELAVDEQYIYEVMFNGMTLLHVRKKNEVIYMRNVSKLEKARADYLAHAEMPKFRMNFYICGVGGAGKGIASRALAHMFFPDLKDEECYFQVGGENVGFEGYDGQPVIIWDDCRAGDLLKLLGSRSNVFNVFDTHPQRKRQNIKYGSTTLINTINIVNSVQGWEEFLDGLAGEYTTKGGEKVTAEDRGQSHRRFGMCIPIYAEDLDIILSKYNMGASDEPTEWEIWRHVTGNFKRVREICGNNEKLARKIESKMLEGIPEKVEEMKSDDEERTEEEIEAYFDSLGYGKTSQAGVNGNLPY